jgi:hypothetical protein
MKHDLNSNSYHLCTTGIGHAAYIYRTCPIIGGDVNLKTTTKTHGLPMRLVFTEVWHASWFMEDSVRSNFDKGGKETAISYVWNIRNVYVALDNNFEIEGN